MDTLTVDTFFTTISGTVTGLVTGAGSFVSTLYATNVIGSIIVTLGMASLVMGFGWKIFKIKRFNDDLRYAREEQARDYRRYGK